MAFVLTFEAKVLVYLLYLAALFAVGGTTPLTSVRGLKPPVRFCDGFMRTTPRTSVRGLKHHRTIDVIDIMDYTPHQCEGCSPMGKMDVVHEGLHPSPV